MVTEIVTEREALNILQLPVESQQQPKFLFFSLFCEFSFPMNTHNEKTLWQ